MSGKRAGTTGTQPPRSEREWLRRQINRFSSMGRFGDWLSFLIMDEPKTAAKVYWMLADDISKKSPPFAYKADIKNFRNEAKRLWPEVVNWTGRKGD